MSGDCQATGQLVVPRGGSTSLRCELPAGHGGHHYDGGVEFGTLPTPPAPDRHQQTAAEDEAEKRARRKQAIWDRRRAEDYAATVGVELTPGDDLGDAIHELWAAAEQRGRDRLARRVGVICNALDQSSTEAERDGSRAVIHARTVLASLRAVLEER